MNEQELSRFIWNIKEIIRNTYDDAEVEDVILPFTLLRRLDCVLEPKRETIQKELDQLPEEYRKYTLPSLLRREKLDFFNTSGLTLAKLLAQPSEIVTNFETYLKGFTDNIQDILANFVHDDSTGNERNLTAIYRRLASNNLLFKVVQEFANVDLSPSSVDNQKMGTVYEDIIRRSKESTNTKAGQYYTPRDVVRLLVALTLSGQEEELKVPGRHFSIYDPACGTGGMLTVARDYIKQVSGRGDDIKVFLYGQELSEKTYAICKSDLLMKGDAGKLDDQIKQGSTLSNDQLQDQHFNFMLANPPFGVDWKKEEDEVRRDNKPGGRFEPGLPSTSDGSLLFLMHMISKMEPDSASRIGIVLNGSPLFNGEAGSGWSNIRKWIIDNDYLDAIVGLPKNIFYGTDISSYLWILSNRRPESHRGKVLFVNATSDRYCRMLQRSLGKKRYEMTDEGAAEIMEMYRRYETRGDAMLLDHEQLRYTAVTVDRPKRLSYANIAERYAALVSDNAIDPKLGKYAILKDVAAVEGIDEQRSDMEFFAYLKEQGVKCKVADVKTLRDWYGQIDEDAPAIYAKPLDEASGLVADINLRDTELIPATEDCDAYFEREVKPFVPDAWMDRSKDKEGCEYPFTKLFYQYQPMRDITDIVADIKKLEEASEGRLADFISNL